MSLPKFFTDEDVYGAVANALRQAGFDAVSTPEADRKSESDESQLEWASESDRVLLTFNVAHFAHLHQELLRNGGHHAGIIVSNQFSLGEVLRRLLRLTQNLDAEAMRDRLEFLSNWQ